MTARDRSAVWTYIMLFSALVIIFIALVAYYHYAQGLFTAAISVGCALLATLVAFGYYENILNLIGYGKMADVEGGVMLLLLFGVTYLLLRVVFDAAVPGNVSFPLYVERIGAAVLGLVVGVLAVGTFAVAVQLMPFGPSVLMSSRFATVNRDADNNERVVIPSSVFGGGNARAKDTGVQHELENNTLDPTAAGGLIMPADGWVLSVVSLASGGGLGGDQAFADVHPDLLTEAFANRLGADGSTARTIYNTTKRPTVDIGGVFTLPAGVNAFDTEIKDIRPKTTPLTLASKSTDGMLVVRAIFEDQASDKDGILRITPAAIRLVVDGVNYHPIGTMADATTIGLNRLDDQIPVSMSGKFRAADFVFEVPKTVTTKLITAGKIKADAGFVEFKLFARADLSGKAVVAYAGPSDNIKILRKPASPLGAATAKAKAAE